MNLNRHRTPVDEVCDKNNIKSSRHLKALIASGEQVQREHVKARLDGHQSDCQCQYIEVQHQENTHEDGQKHMQEFDRPSQSQPTQDPDSNPANQPIQASVESIRNNKKPSLVPEFCKGIDQSILLDVHQLDGVVQLIHWAEPGYLDKADLVKLLEFLSARLNATHA
ncbi:hypothetical protein BGX34_009653 [Mortierella sp. NVP85]|nr:hypothetical protein BGX34_009653 [Mortierella sp. NVP85]